MKTIANIFEGIFDQNTDRLESRAMLDDPNSAFNKEWGSQISIPKARSNDFKKFEISNNLLGIGIDAFDTRDPFDIRETITINYKYPLTKYLPDIGGIRVNCTLDIHMKGYALTPNIFGPIISSYMFTHIDGADSIHDVQFKGHADKDIHKKLEAFNCIDFSNCIFDGITQIKIDHVPQISRFTKCKSDTLLRIDITGDDVFKNSWPEFENLIDYDKLGSPVNKQTGKPVSARIMDLSKIASIMKYRHKYSWENYKEIPLITSGQNIVKKLFPNCNFPRLESMTITGAYAFLNINIKKNLCFMMSRTDRPR